MEDYIVLYEEMGSEKLIALLKIIRPETGLG